MEGKREVKGLDCLAECGQNLMFLVRNESLSVGLEVAVGRQEVCKKMQNEYICGVTIVDIQKKPYLCKDIVSCYSLL